MSVLVRYTLEEEIGRGATGTVFRARERGALGRTVALKRIRGAGRSTAAAAWREAQVLSTLDHPNVVRVLDVVRDGPGTAVVMAYAAGGSLERRLGERGPLPHRDLGRVFLPIADALGAAHRAGVVHGDVKPANILFTSDGDPLLSDFGAARWLDVTRNAPLAVGTVGYLDPELFHAPTVDARSDVYSLGVTCFETLTGLLPFPATNADEILACADRGRTLRLTDHVRDVPPDVVEVIERAMARRSDERFASAAAFAAALRGALDGHVVVHMTVDDQRTDPTPASSQAPADRTPRPQTSSDPDGRVRVTTVCSSALTPGGIVLCLVGLLVLAVAEVLLLAPEVAATLVILQVPVAVGSVLALGLRTAGNRGHNAGSGRDGPRCPIG